MEAALEALRRCPPRDLARSAAAAEGGVAPEGTPLEALFGALCRAGALAEAGPTRLQTPCRALEAPRGGVRGGRAGWHLAALFDAAVEWGHGAVVARYVREVCQDAFAVSSNATEAYLMDGAMVRGWAAAYLQALAEDLERALALLAGTGDWPAGAERLHKLWIRASGLLEVLAALAEEPAGAPDAGVGELGERARRIRLASDVTLWCVLHEQHKAPPAGKLYGTVAEWRGALQSRRQAARHSYLGYLAGAKAAAAALAYPPAGVTAAVQAIFLAPDAGPEFDSGRCGADHACTLLFLYYLMELGVADELLNAYRVQFEVPLEEFAEVRGGVILDVGRSGELDTGCDLLCTAAGSRSPPLLAWCMLDRQKPEKAHYYVNVRENSLLAERDHLALEDALLGLNVRLACGRLHEAFLAAQQQWTAVPDAAQRGAHARALTERLCDFCLTAKLVNRLIELPFLEEEERVVVATFRRWAADRDPSAIQWPLYLLLRDRVPEAVAAYREVAEQLGGGGEGGMEVDHGLRDKALKYCRAILRTSCALLPEAQQQQVVLDEPL